MRERDRYPHGVPCWIDTAQPDPQAAARFYGDLFGWTLTDQMPPDSPGRYFMAQLRGFDVAAIGSQPPGSPPTPIWNTYVAVGSADDAAARVRDAGGRVLAEPFDVFDSGRMAMCADPSGAMFNVWQANRHIGAQVVNEPGTWNFSTLNTRDQEGSKAFYGAVFGWEAATFDLGAGDVTMWRMPGYGDYLVTLNPDLLRMQESSGAPPGFEDAIGWMALMTNDQFPQDTPPHWSTTFAVADADTVAGRAAELGGRVLEPPFDAPFVRSAVLSDPQGAVFTVSKFVPRG